LGAWRIGSGRRLRCAKDEILDKELHHAILVDGGVALIGADLDFKALAGLLESLDQLHGVVRVDVVVGRPIEEQEAPLEIRA